MKKKLIILIIIAFLLIIFGIIGYFTNNNDIEKNTSKGKIENKEAISYIENLTNIIMNGGSKKELITALHTNQILDTDIMTGKDMYLLQRPNEKLIKKYNLEDYVKVSKNLANKLENAIKNNFEYKINNVSNVEDYISVELSYKTYYYTAYLNDLSQIQRELLIKAGYNLENITESEKVSIDLYKSKIKAATILNDCLDKYNNENEYKETVVSYHNKTIEDSAEEFYSYLINLTGFTYGNKSIFNNEEDLNELLSKYDLDNPLAI